MKLKYIIIIIIVCLHAFSIDFNCFGAAEKIEFSSFGIQSEDEAINQISS